MLYHQSKKALLANKIPSGTVIYNSNGATGTFTITIPKTQNYFVRLVGGGASGVVTYAWYSNGNWGQSGAGGGAGGMVSGVIRLEKGTYTGVIAASVAGNVKYALNNQNKYYSTAGNSTTFAGITASGGGRATAQFGAGTSVYPEVHQGGSGGSGNAGSYTGLTITTGGAGKGQTSLTTAGKIMTCAGGSSPYSGYGAGGSAGNSAVYGTTTLYANSGGKGYLYIEAR